MRIPLNFGLPISSIFFQLNFVVTQFNREPSNNTVNVSFANATGVNVSLQPATVFLFGPTGTTPVHFTSTVTTTSAPQTTISPVVQYQDFGGCSCDLTVRGCDINCCCDLECTDTDKTTFSVDCASQARQLDYLHSESCFADTVLMRNSSPLPSYRLPSGSICLIYDNNPQRLFYREPPAVKNESDYDAPWQARGISNAIFTVPPDSAEILQVLARNPKAPSFKIGDPIFALRNSDRIAHGLEVPSSGQLSTRCLGPKFLAFLNDTSSACSWGLTNLASDCTGNPLFRMDTFVNYSVIRSADAFSIANSTSGFLDDFSGLPDSVLATVTVPVVVESLLIKDDTGNIQSVPLTDGVQWPTPAFSDASRTCVNVITSVQYMIYFNGSHIAAVNCSVFLSSIVQPSGAFEQRFHMAFVSAATSGDEVLRSGNPGYLDGSAVLVATLFNPAIIPVDPQLAEDLSLPGVDSNGLCRNTDTERVAFGENVQMSCTVLIDIHNPTAACQNIQAQLMAAMANGRDVPTNASVYGNGTAFSADGWIEVLHHITTEDMSFVPPKLCRNIVTGLSIEIAYSRVGFLTNPQSKITGVLYRFLEPVDILLECPFHGCTGGTYLPIELQFAVSFSDFSQAAVDLRSLQPPASRFLPADFFAPY